MIYSQLTDIINELFRSRVFSVNKKPPSLNSAEYEVLIDLTSHSELKISFQDQGITDFWLNLQDEFKILSDKAKLLLLPFSTTYLCVAGFLYIAKV